MKMQKPSWPPPADGYSIACKPEDCFDTPPTVTWVEKIGEIILTSKENPKRQYGVRKPRPHFIPPVAIIEEAAVMALGASKYGPFNWQKDPIDASTYYDAALRHLMSWFAGEDRDRESGLLHLAHARACLAILIDSHLSKTLIDDRPKTSSAADLIASHERREDE